MGSWNATCQVSQLPILVGEKVRFLLLVKNPLHSKSERKIRVEELDQAQSIDQFGYQPINECGQEFCYSTEAWSPSFVPIRGTYNDYGSVENLDTSSLNWLIWMDRINNEIFPLKQGPNQYHDLATYKNMPLEHLLDVLRSGRLLFSDDYTKSPTPVCQTMIREDVYQNLLDIKRYVYDKSYNKVPLTPNDLYKEGLKFLSSEQIKFVIDNKLPSLCVRAPINFDIIDGTRNHLSSYGEWFVEELRNKQLNTNSKECKSLVKDIADFIHVSAIMVKLRKTWQPGSGCGSQAYEITACHDFYSKMANLAKTLIKKEEEDQE